jgi:hypothetical protein
VSDPDVATAQRSAAALARYRTRLRRPRLIYAGSLVVLVVLTVVGVAVAWANGETAHVTLHTVKAAPGDLPDAPPSATLHESWRTTDRAALGTPRWKGTVVTYDQHTVRGRNARTGAQTWSYTRTDRSVCSALQVRGATIAVYAVDGNCDELTALDSSSGARMWTRTLDEDGRPVNGRPAYQVLDTGGYGTAVIHTPRVIYAIDPSSGLDRWTWQHYGCTIRGVVVGTAGALISQSCTRQQDCGERRFCGPGVQLVLRDATLGYDDTDHPKNPDRIIWNKRGNSDLPVTADSPIWALNPSTRALDTYDATKGSPGGSITLAPAPPSVAPITATVTSSGEVVTIGGRTYALAGRRVDWSAATAQPPTVVATDESDPPTLASSRLTVPAASGIQTLRPATGRVLHTYPVPAGDATVVWPLGTGFLVASPSATVAYR